MKNKKLSVIIPCYNEKDLIVEVIRKVRACGISNLEIIIVDDFSTDGTRDILQKKLASKVDRIIYQGSNMGKGAALRTGFKAATGDVVIVQDADLEYDPKDYATVVTPIFNNECDVVYGSRFMNGRDKGYKMNLMANQVLTKMTNIVMGVKLTDMETCYKAFKIDIIKSIDIVENRFGFEPEITAKLIKNKIKIKEVPISYYPRKVSEGKKVKFKDGFRAIFCIIKYRF